MHRSFLGFGSNVNAEDNIIKAIEFIKKEDKIDLIKVSSFYKTSPLGVTEQDDFYNGLCEIKTVFSPYDLKDFLKSIEASLGREIKEKKSFEEKYGPRVMDIDILLYDDLVINENNVHIPDIDIMERVFIAKALYELDMDLIIPGINLPIKDVLLKLEKTNAEPLLLETFTRKVQSIV